MAWYFSHFNLFPQYTALQNVTLAETASGTGTSGLSSRIRKQILAEIEEHGKDSCLERRWDWQIARVIIRTSYPVDSSRELPLQERLALKPDILCFDEPTSALDPELTGEVLNVSSVRLADQKTTMIIVTHEMAFARDVADQIIFMDDGYIVEQGDAKQVIDHPKEERTRQFLSRYSQG